MTESEPAPRQGATPNRTVLLVDDSPMILRALRQTLAGEPYVLVEAESGEEALEVAAREKPALVLLDVQMPGIDGFETCARLKANPDLASAAVIFVSALGQTADKVRGLTVGGVDFVTKPFEVDEVIARVRAHMDLHALRAGLEVQNARLESEVAQLRDPGDERAPDQRAPMGGYELVEMLCRGGMGEVWRAHHKLLSRHAAIKLIDHSAAGISAEDAVRRFHREAEATSQLTSPHTVTLFDFGLNGDGTYYYVMELLKGIDFKRLVDRYGPLPPERALTFLTQACHSLGEAHACGLVHRDVKPANLMACSLGLQFDFVKVLDFGIVKGELVSKNSVLADVEAYGTPGYVAPELSIPGRTVDQRADVYSLGCLSFFLLTGRDVFVGETPGEVIAQHVNRQPEPPSRYAPGSPAESDAEIDAVVLRCLAKKPEDRFADANALRDALEAIKLPRAWRQDRAKAWWSTHLPHLANAEYNSESATVPFLPVVPPKRPPMIRPTKFVLALEDEILERNAGKPPQPSTGEADQGESASPS